MSTSPTSVADLIGKWKTITEFAADVGCGYEAARQMKRRKSIAPEHWQNVVSAAKAKKIPGVSLEWLAMQRASEAA
jgi:hypothetical protein